MVARELLLQRAFLAELDTWLGPCPGPAEAPGRAQAWATWSASRRARAARRPTRCWSPTRWSLRRAARRRRWPPRSPTRAGPTPHTTSRRAPGAARAGVSLRDPGPVGSRTPSQPAPANPAHVSMVGGAEGLVRARRRRARARRRSRRRPRARRSSTTRTAPSRRPRCAARTRRSARPT